MTRDPAVSAIDVAPKHPTAERLETTYPPRRASAAPMRRALRTYLRKRALKPDVVCDLVLAADEAFSNAVRHAGSTDDLIHVTACASAGEAVVVVRDGGSGFTFRRSPAQPVPDVSSVGGRGVFLIERLMDEVSVRSGREGTTVRMVRHLA